MQSRRAGKSCKRGLGDDRRYKDGPAAEMAYSAETGILTISRFKFSFIISCRGGGLSLEGPFMSCLSLMDMFTFLSSVVRSLDFSLLSDWCSLNSMYLCIPLQLIKKVLCHVINHPDEQPEYFQKKISFLFLKPSPSRY